MMMGLERIVLLLVDADDQGEAVEVANVLGA